MKYYLLNEKAYKYDKNQNHKRIITIWKTWHTLSSKLIFHSLIRNDSLIEYRPRDLVEYNDIYPIIVSESENIDELIEMAAFEAL